MYRLFSSFILDTSDFFSQFWILGCEIRSPPPTLSAPEDFGFWIMERWGETNHVVVLTANFNLKSKI